ncbi:tRNA 2-selenouridine synthase [Virgibacillus pantothenticus]|nr:tRNA 2-selenouridine synthase [Virgibacillus pantothenticus]SIS94308.1 tRNA 2-selenouridine synthase [Virgibacillus pantothenticus]
MERGGKTLFQDMTIEELRSIMRTEKLALIDVRSPSEYNNATIPGSINIPFFNDVERAEIGTLYKQVSPETAKERGLQIISAKLPDFVKRFSKIEGKKVVFCWRGGMRSKTSATVLDLMGIHVHRLKGGYRCYRNWVVQTMENLEWNAKALVLNGHTGSGKTKMLKKLAQENYPVIDLEGMANHRGSIFGQIGLQPHNQKTFDALLIEQIELFKQSPVILVEGESKRIGRVLLPDFLLAKKAQGMQFIIEVPIEQRTKEIINEYQPWKHEKACLEAFRRIKKRIHTPIAKTIEEDLKLGRYDIAVRLLLEYYYDPLYDYTTKQIPNEKKIIIKAKDITEAYRLLKEQIDRSYRIA